jgi:hypothetical protein
MRKKVRRRFQSEALSIEVVGLGRSVDRRIGYAKLRASRAGEAMTTVFKTEELGQTKIPVVFDWLSRNAIVLHTGRKQLIADIERQLSEHAGPASRVSVVADRRGWNGDHFVSFYGMHSPPGEKIWRPEELKFRAPSADGLTAARAAYHRYGRNNALVKFCVSASFMGPLLDVVEANEQPSFVLLGKAGIGKSSLGQLIAATWGGRGEGLLGNVESLSATTNKFEGTLAEANDMVLVADDLQAWGDNNPTRRAADLYSLIMRVWSGRTKDRMTEEAVSFRVVTFIASNESVAAIMTRGSKPYDDALSSRVIELDCECGQGVFKTVPDGVTAKQLADEMKEAAQTFAGAPGERFAEYFVRELNADRDGLRRKVQKLFAECECALKHCFGQSLDRHHGRRAAIFNLVYAAGVLAHDYGIHNWSKKKVLKAVKAIFERCYKTFEQRRHERDPRVMLANYVERNVGRFARINCGEGQVSKKKLQCYLGIVAEDKRGRLSYAFLPPQLDRAFGGRRPTKSVLMQLASDGVLRGDKGKLQTKLKGVPDSRPRVYEFDAGILYAAIV